MKKFMTLLSVILLTLAPMQTAQAKEAAVSVSCHAESKVEGLEVSLYHIGELDGKTIKFDDGYVGIKSPNLSSTKEIQACAQSVDSRIKGSGYKAGFSAKTDKSGNLQFDKVPYGVYCAVSGKLSSGNKIYSVIPVVLIVDGNTSVELKMNVEAVKKNKGEKISVSVNKKWELGKDGKTSPVTIALLRNNNTVDTIVLNDRNNWKYTWTDLDADSVYTVIEHDVPEGFLAELSQKGNSFTITNKSVSYLKATPQTGIGSSMPLGYACITLAALAVIAIIIILSKGDKTNEA